MLFQSRFHDGIRRGDLTCTVRIWKAPRVRIGGCYRLGAGAIRVDRIQEMEFDALTPALARRSGFASVVELLKVAKHGAGERIFLIEFHYLDAPPPRAADDGRATETLADVERKLDAMDRRARQPWTRATLREIAKHPGERAADLAVSLERDRLELKRDIRKLKALGLTNSLEVGYRLTRRGKMLAAGSRRKP
jgi:hypothetical protein